jgi:hypothetical protein
MTTKTMDRMEGLAGTTAHDSGHDTMGEPCAGRWPSGGQCANQADADRSDGYCADCGARIDAADREALLKTRAGECADCGAIGVHVETGSGEIVVGCTVVATLRVGEALPLMASEIGGELVCDACEMVRDTKRNDDEVRAALEDETI